MANKPRAIKILHNKLMLSVQCVFLEIIVLGINNQ